MLKLLFGQVLGFLSPNKYMIAAIAILFSTSVGAGYLLKNSYVENGKQSALTEQWQAASGHWNTAYVELDAKMTKREQERNDAWAETEVLKEKLRKIQDETNCLDTNVPIDLRMLFLQSETAAFD